MIPNPEYSDDESIGKYASFGVVAFELWQVKAGTIFDNLLITDDVAEAEALRKATWEKSKDGEKEMFDKLEADKKKVEDEKAKEAGESSEGDDEEPEEPEDAEASDDKDEV
jgi:calreticulin